MFSSIRASSRKFLTRGLRLHSSAQRFLVYGKSDPSISIAAKFAKIKMSILWKSFLHINIIIIKLIRVNKTLFEKLLKLQKKLSKSIGCSIKANFFKNWKQEKQLICSREIYSSQLKKCNHSLLLHSQKKVWNIRKIW